MTFESIFYHGNVLNIFSIMLLLYKPARKNNHTTTNDSTNTNDNPTKSAKSETSEEDPEFPFETDPDDHCESPLDAYQDIVPFLEAYQE